MKFGGKAQNFDANTFWPPMMPIGDYGTDPNKLIPSE